MSRAANQLRHRFDLEDFQPRFPPGVYKHRSIEDAELLREEWDRENFERFLARRAAASGKRVGSQQD